jgi:hypothetical protein
LTFDIGKFETLSVAELWSWLVASIDAHDCTTLGGLSYQQIVDDVGLLHRDPNNAGAVFQVASQFNCLEMVTPSITPEDGITNYYKLQIIWPRQLMKGLRAVLNRKMSFGILSVPAPVESYVSLQARDLALDVMITMRSWRTTLRSLLTCCSLLWLLLVGIDALATKNPKKRPVKLMAVCSKPHPRNRNCYTLLG